MNLKISRLSDRLNLVYEHLIPNQDVWDFCCDHGYLGGTAYKSEKFKNIYFVDQVEALIKKIENKFELFVFNENNKSQAYFLPISAQKIKQNIFGTICITGVGTTTIYQILNELNSHGYLKAQRLILGPHKDEKKLVELITQNTTFKNYIFIGHKEIIENGRTRLIFIFDCDISKNLAIA